MEIKTIIEYLEGLLKTKMEQQEFNHDYMKRMEAEILTIKESIAALKSSAALKSFTVLKDENNYANIPVCLL